MCSCTYQTQTKCPLAPETAHTITYTNIYTWEKKSHRSTTTLHWVSSHTDCIEYYLIVFSVHGWGILHGEMGIWGAIQYYMYIEQKNLLYMYINYWSHAWTIPTIRKVRAPHWSNLKTDRQISRLPWTVLGCISIFIHMYMYIYIYI